MEDQPLAGLNVFDEIINHTEGLAKGIAKFRGHPIIDQGEAVRSEIRELSVRMDTGFAVQTAALVASTTSLLTAIADLRQDTTQSFATLRLQLAAVNSNNTSRHANSMIRNADHSLTPLCNINTNRRIGRFPATPRALMRLSGTRLNEILLALGASIDGSIEARKERLRGEVGLTLEAV